MEIRHCIHLIHSDLHRTGRGGVKSFVCLPGFKYLVFWRLLKYTSSHKALLPFTCFLRFILLLMQYHYGIKIGEKVEIGRGFYIYHYGGIFINGKVRIGDNVDIYHDVTLGTNIARNGKGGGAPIIGNYVVIGAGAKVLGPITIGNNVAIGANAVVVKDVPDNVSVAGIPAKVISRKGSNGLFFCPIR